MITSNPKPGFPACGCTGRGEPGPGGYHLRHMIAALGRMNGHPAGADIEPEPEDDDRHGGAAGPRPGGFLMRGADDR